MAARRAQRKPRRTVALLVLFVFVIPAALLPATGRVSPNSDCPFSAGTTASSVVSTPGDCGHSTSSTCQILVCNTVVPAVRQVGGHFDATAEFFLVQLGATPRFVDLFHTGPPTPPPNQI